ncbi:MAG: hypothetical protein WBD55_10925 [Dehalococcoidia bacterium]
MSTTTMKVGRARVTISKTRRNGSLEAAIELDCKHSTTMAHYVDPNEPPRLSDRDLVLIACEKALAEAPCSCVRALRRQYEAGC